MLGAGSWGTTVAALSAGRNPTLLWARNPDVAAAVNDKHENPSYLAGFTLPEGLRATSDLAEAVSSAEVLVVGVPSTASGSCSRRPRPMCRTGSPSSA